MVESIASMIDVRLFWVVIVFIVLFALFAVRRRDKRQTHARSHASDGGGWSDSGGDGGSGD